MVCLMNDARLDSCWLWCRNSKKRDPDFYEMIQIVLFCSRSQTIFYLLLLGWRRVVVMRYHIRDQLYQLCCETWMLDINFPHAWCDSSWGLLSNHLLLEGGGILIDGSYASRRGSELKRKLSDDVFLATKEHERYWCIYPLLGHFSRSYHYPPAKEYKIRWKVKSNCIACLGYSKLT